MASPVNGAVDSDNTGRQGRRAPTGVGGRRRGRQQRAPLGGEGRTKAHLAVPTRARKHPASTEEQRDDPRQRRLAGVNAASRGAPPQNVATGQAGRMNSGETPSI